MRQKIPMIASAMTPMNAANRKPPNLVRSSFVNAATMNAPKTVAEVTASERPTARLLDRDVMTPTNTENTRVKTPRIM